MIFVNKTEGDFNLNSNENNRVNNYDFEVTPRKIVTTETIIGFCGVTIATIICELAFTPIIFWFSLAILFILIIELIHQKNKSKISVKNNSLYYRNSVYECENIKFIKVTVLGNVYIHCSETTIKIHKSYEGYNKLCNWAKENHIVFMDSTA